MTKAEASKRAIRAALAGQGRSQMWLAGKLGISDTLLSKILAGYRSPSREMADTIRTLTGVELLPKSSEVTR